MTVSYAIVSPLRLFGGMNKSIPTDRLCRYRIFPSKLKSDIKKQPVNAKYTQCHCIVSELSCKPWPCIFDIINLGPLFEKTRLRTVTFPMYFLILAFFIMAFNHQSIIVMHL